MAVSSILGRDARDACPAPLPRDGAAVSAEFNWWLLIVGLIAGGALTWLVLADTTRREQELDAPEVDAEAAWIARTLGQPAVDADVAADVLRAHRRYLGYPPPDTLVDQDELVATDGSGALAATAVAPPEPPAAP
jgi:hypothetical protein